MAGLWNISSLWSCTLVLLTYVYLCNGCTPTSPPTILQKVDFSDVFMYGKVVDIYKGGYMYDTLYTMKVEVYCIFKGPLLDQFINVTYAGHEPGLCISNQFKKDNEYLLFLEENGNELRPQFNEEPYDANLADDISLYCDVKSINYPKGVGPDNSTRECPVYYDYEDYGNCMAYEPPSSTPEPGTTTETAGEVVVKTMAPDDSKAEDSVETGSLEGSGGRILASLLVTVLCLVLSVF